ncbi:hypothetical protein F5883DRAFT_574014 [Diaporthe sp. PMI_573]|nr:hypothetical protein F5883DRAFT_574014 [Diaporthaceae sp. PMI_573]
MSAPEAQSTTLCLARPEAVSPLSVTGRARLNRVCIRHPGYKSDPNNILLNLPAVDSYRHGDPANPQIRRGLHHRTVLTAGAIIANNAFNRAFLTHDQAGNERVAAGLDGILVPGDYWLHLEHEEAARGPPPPRRGSSASSPHSQTPAPYPVVPSFRDWRFPHGQLPSEWGSSHQPPPPPLGPEPNSALPAPAHVAPLPAAPPPCCVTALRTGVERCHLVPQAGLLKEWFISNAMAQYASDPARGIADMASIAVMRSDIHSMFDASRFAIVPKPSAGSSTSSASAGSSSSSYALAVHVLNEGFDELTPLYHNVAIQSSSAEVFSSEFLFARFALSLFPLVQSFIDSPAPRHIAVSKLDTSEEISKLAWMNGREFAQHREQRGESRNGSKKRGSSNISRDGQDPADVDSAECCRSPKRRSRSHDYPDFYLYGRGGQTEACTKWCDGHSQSTDEIELFGLEGMDVCKWWRDETAQPDSQTWEEEEMFRGRPRHRAPDSLSAAAPRDPPSLSCSSTSTASDGSSAVAWDSWVPRDLGDNQGGSGHKTLDPGGPDAEEQPS